MTKKSNRVRNWAEYNKALVQRGSVTLWIDEEVLRQWYNVEDKAQGRGRPKVYSDKAIETCLVLRMLFWLPLRATEGLVRSLLKIVKAKQKVPSYTQLCRRQKSLGVKLKHEVKGKIHVVVDGTGLKVYGEGEWKVRQHGWTKHRMWRKLPIGIDVQTQEIVMMELSDNKVGENKKLRGLLKQYRGGYKAIGGDKGYDSYECHETVGAYGAISGINIQEDAKEREIKAGEARWVRDQSIRRIAEVGKEQWKEEVKYHQRSLVETAMFRYKTILGAKMHARTLENQRKEALIGCNILNTFTRLGRLQSYGLT